MVSESVIVVEGEGVYYDASGHVDVLVPEGLGDASVHRHAVRVVALLPRTNLEFHPTSNLLIAITFFFYYVLTSLLI